MKDPGWTEVSRERFEELKRSHAWKIQFGNGGHYLIGPRRGEAAKSLTARRRSSGVTTTPSREDAWLKENLSSLVCELAPYPERHGELIGRAAEMLSRTCDDIDASRRKKAEWAGLLRLRAVGEALRLRTISRPKALAELKSLAPEVFSVVLVELVERWTNHVIDNTTLIHAISGLVALAADDGSPTDQNVSDLLAGLGARSAN